MRGLSKGTYYRWTLRGKKKSERREAQGKAKRRDQSSKAIEQEATVSIGKYKELLQEYRNLKKELQELRKKQSRKIGKPSKRNGSDKVLLSAKALIYGSNTELSDCSQLLHNFCGLLASKKLKGESLQFHLICLLIRQISKPKEDRKNEMPSTLAQFFAIREKSQLVEFFTNFPSLPLSPFDPGQNPLHYQPVAPTYHLVQPLYSSYGSHTQLALLPYSEEHFQHLGLPSSQDGVESVLAERSSLPSSISQGETKGHHLRGKRHANALIGLNSSMLKQFDFENSHPQQTEREKQDKQKKRGASKKKKKC